MICRRIIGQKIFTLTLVLVLWGLCRGQRLTAQEYRYELGGALGASSYVGDAVRRPFGRYSAVATFLGRYNLNFRAALTSSLGYVGLRGDTGLADNAFPGGATARFATHSLQWSLGGEHNFFALSDKYRYLQTSSWSPYIGGGALLALAWSNEASVLAPGVYLSCGIKYMLSSRLTIAAEWRIQQYLSDRLDALGRDAAWLANPFALNRSFKGGDGAMLISIGVTYHTGLRNRSSCYSM